MGNFPLLITEQDKDLLGSESRTDAMGVLAIWSIRGRDLVPHLTATSSRARGFQILVEALHLWAIYQEKYSQHAGRPADFFLLIEQAFGRTIGSEHWTLPGNRRIAAREHLAPRISIADSSWHLLGSQIQNGTWGAYMGAARRAGLIDEKPIRLTSTSQQQARDNTYFKLPAQQKLFLLIHKAMNGETVEIPTDGRNALKRAILSTFHNLPLSNHLHRQIIESTDLCRLLAGRLLSSEELDHRALLSNAANSLSNHRETIENVMHCENFLSVVESTFHWLCASKGDSVEDAASKLPVDLDRLRRAHESFADSGDYGAGIGGSRAKLFRDQIDTSSRVDFARSVLLVHEQVSNKRRRSPWVWKSDQGLLLCDEVFDYPSNEEFEVGIAWRNSYYLNSLKQVATDLHEASS